MHERSRVEGFCGSDIFIRSAYAQIDAFLVGAYNSFAVGIGAQPHYLSSPYIFRTLVVDRGTQMLVALDAFFDLVARPGCAFVLVVARVAHLRILSTL